MTPPSPEGKKKADGTIFDIWLPRVLLLQFCAIVVIVGCFAGGVFGEGAIPKQYYTWPWGGEAVTNVMGLEVNSVGTFLVVAAFMFLLSFLSALTARAMSIWEWETVNFSNPNKAINQYKTKYWLIVSFCGTFFLSITTIVNLFFSVTSVWYLLAAALGRVLATCILGILTRQARTDAKPKDDTQSMFIKSR